MKDATYMQRAIMRKPAALPVVCRQKTFNCEILPLQSSGIFQVAR